MKYNFLLFLTFFVFGCGTKNPKITHSSSIVNEYYANGQVQFSYTINDGKRNGPYKSFYDDGSIWAVGSYKDGSLDSNLVIYKPDGTVAMEEVWKSGWLHEQKVYWQKVKSEFLFVSNEGFYTIKNGTAVDLDSNTPDNVLERRLENMETIWYIWKGGKREKLPN